MTEKINSRLTSKIRNKFVQLVTNKPRSFKNDFLSGLTVALALIPEAVAFSFVAGVDPKIGLYAAFLMGLIATIFGGRPGMITGATGAVAVIFTALVASHGVDYLFAAVALMGMLQIGFGLLKLGKFIRLIPHPVMLGFVNGLAIIIFKAQFGQFYHVVDGVETLLPSMDLLIMGGLIALTMAICIFLPKLTKALPATLVAIVVVSLIGYGLNSSGTTKIRTVLDFVKDGAKKELVKKENKALESLKIAEFEKNASGIEGATADLKGIKAEYQNLPNVTLKAGLPTFKKPNVPFSLEMLKVILPYAILAAAVGLIESLMTLTLVDELTGTRGKGNKECIGQGLANLANGFFGGMGGCAMIGQSMINIKSGGRGRTSGITAAIALLLFVVAGASLIEVVPLAALVGVMFMVVIGTFEWTSLRLFKKIPFSDIFVIILVSTVTVFVDLAVAVLVGVIASALVFAWEHGKNVQAKTEVRDNLKLYFPNGPIFFGSVSSFKELFDFTNDPKEVVIDFTDARVCDHSGLEALNNITERYAKAGTKLHLTNLSKECSNLLEKAENIVELSVIEDLEWHLAEDKLD